MFIKGYIILSGNIDKKYMEIKYQEVPHKVMKKGQCTCPNITQNPMISEIRSTYFLKMTCKIR